MLLNPYVALDVTGKVWDIKTGKFRTTPLFNLKNRCLKSIGIEIELVKV